MLKSSAPLVGISNGSAWRKQGLFYRKSIQLSDVERVMALKRDMLTGEEVYVAFTVGGKIKFFVSEFDCGYQDFIDALPTYFPYIRNISEMDYRDTFEAVDFLLWPCATQASTTIGS